MTFNVDRAIALLPGLVASTPEFLAMLKSLITAGDFSGDMAKFQADKAEYLGAIDFLAQVAAFSVPA